MKTVSKIMYIIGMISVVLTLILGITGIIIFAIGLANPEFAAKLTESMENAGAPAAIMGAGLGLFIYLAVASLIVLSLSVRAIKNLNRGNGRVGTHILLLIGGIFCWDIFYVLGGIFGIIGASKD